MLRLGLDPTTKIVGSSAEREDILAARIAQHHKMQFQVTAWNCVLLWNS